jgi:Integrase core domain
VYWLLYRSPQEAREKLEDFRQRYNEIRPHWALRPSAAADPITPAEVYRDGKFVELPAWQGWAKAAKEKLEKFHNPAGRPCPSQPDRPRGRHSHKQQPTGSTSSASQDT